MNTDISYTFWNTLEMELKTESLSQEGQIMQRYFLIDMIDH